MAYFRFLIVDKHYLVNIGIFYVGLEKKILDQIFIRLQIFFFSLNPSPFSFPKQNLRKLPIMYFGSTLVYHATLVASD